MLHVSLRICLPQHLPQLQAVATKSYQEHYRYLWTTEEQVQWYMERSFSLTSLKKQIAEPGSLFYLVFFEDKECGFIKINRNRHLPHAPNSWELERIYLLRAYAGRGIGSAVMHQIVEMAKENGSSSIWLKSMDSSPSIRFYQHCGFRKTGTERLAFEGLRDEYRNMWIMERKI